MSSPPSVSRSWHDALENVAYEGKVTPERLKKFARSAYIQKILAYSPLQPGARVLEPGCGSGKFSLSFAYLDCDVVILDFVPSILEEVKENERGVAGYLPRPVSAYHQGDLENLPYPDHHFDLVLNEGVVEHWLDYHERQEIFKEMIRVTRPGGIVAILVPNGCHPLVKQWDREFFDHAPPMSYFDADRLGKELREAGLEEVKTDGIDPWRSWTRYGIWRKGYKVAAAFDHLIPLPRTLRQKWAFNLIAIGRKPALH